MPLTLRGEVNELLSIYTTKDPMIRAGEGLNLQLLGDF